MKEREPGQKPMYMGSEEITISGGNEGIKMDERNNIITKLDRIMNEIIIGTTKVGEISNKCMKVV